MPPPDDPGLGRLELALDKVMAAAPAAQAVKAAVRAGKLAREPEDTLLERALKAGAIDEAALKRIREAEKGRDDAIQVDEFDSNEVRPRGNGEPEEGSYRPERAVNPTRAR